MDVVIVLIAIVAFFVFAAKRISRAKPLAEQQSENNQKEEKTNFALVLSQCERVNVNQDLDKFETDVANILIANGYKQGDLSGHDSERLRISMTKAFLKQNVVPPRDLTLMFSTLLIPKKETVYFGFENLELYSTKRTREFVAGSRGVSFRVAKGVSFRVGNSRGEFVTNEKGIYLGGAEVAITSAGIRIRIDTKAKLVKFEKIISVYRSSDTDLVVITDGERSAPLRFSGEPYQIDFLKEMIQEAAN